MIENLYSIFLESSGISTDTRKIKSGSIFFALKGTNFNGNHFAGEAIANGAITAVIDEEKYQGEGMFLVEDVLKTLQELASYHRDQFDIPIVALTGSNGKTTTKELIANILKQKFKVHSTRGNLNNHIGVPLTLLAMLPDTEIAIIEMGANHQGEIKQLAEIAKPNFGLITNIGKAHLKGFGGLEGVKKGKLELYDYITSNGGNFFVSSSDPVLSKEIIVNVIKYELIEPASVQPSIEFYFKEYLIKSVLFGGYNFQNIMASITIAQYFNVKILDIIYGIESYIPSNNRSELILKGSNTIILDAYNANPTSIFLSIENFKKRDGKKIAVLGSMKELGQYSSKEHETLVEQTALCDFETVIFFGEEFHNLNISQRDHHCRTIKEIKTILDLENRKNYTILIKGSRSNRLELILN